MMPVSLLLVMLLPVLIFVGVAAALSWVEDTVEATALTKSV
jgi:hypothetical protein